jgi:hypothetical protein
VVQQVVMEVCVGVGVSWFVWRRYKRVSVGRGKWEGR